MKKEITQKDIDRAAEKAARSRQASCDHSFNSSGECEYCGADEENFFNSGDSDLGVYQ